MNITRLTTQLGGMTRSITQARSMTRLMEWIGGQAGTSSRGAWKKITKKPGGGFESRAKNTRDLELRSGTAIKVMKPETDERDSIVGQKQDDEEKSQEENEGVELQVTKRKAEQRGGIVETSSEDETSSDEDNSQTPEDTDQSEGNREGEEAGDAEANDHNGSGNEVSTQGDSRHA